MTIEEAFEAFSKNLPVWRTATVPTGCIVVETNILGIERDPASYAGNVGSVWKDARSEGLKLKLRGLSGNDISLDALFMTKEDAIRAAAYRQAGIVCKLMTDHRKATDTLMRLIDGVPDKEVKVQILSLADGTFLDKMEEGVSYGKD